MRVLASAEEIVLRGEATRVSLTLSEDLDALRDRPENDFYLLLHDLHADEQPGVVYSLYLGTGDHGSEPKLGTINFYGANPTRSGFSSFEIPRAAVEGSASESLVVTIRPMGEPADGTPPKVGRIELAVAR
ncbi:MAG: hypothetical protein AAF725_09055 [Acidobacteriota bacterium]